MPKGKANAVQIPTDARFAIVDGEQFVRLRDAAKLAGIHPTVLAMGKELLTRVGGSGAAFALATPDLQRSASDVAKQFKTGLRRYAKAMEPQRKIRLRAFKDGARLVFWYYTTGK